MDSLNRLIKMKEDFKKNLETSLYDKIVDIFSKNDIPYNNSKNVFYLSNKVNFVADVRCSPLIGSHTVIICIYACFEFDKDIHSDKFLNDFNAHSYGYKLYKTHINEDGDSLLILRNMFTIEVNNYSIGDKVEISSLKEKEILSNIKAINDISSKYTNVLKVFS